MRPSQYETITSPSRLAPGGVGRFRDVQTVSRKNWVGVPDDQAILASLHRVHVTPAGGTHTITQVTPLDPGTTLDSGDPASSWLAIPGHNGRLFAAGRYR